MAKILIVDDNDDVRFLVSRILKDNGYEVLEASDGEKAISVLRETKCDLMLLDVIMPHRGGIESLFLIKEEFPKISIIFITGKVPEDSDGFKNLARTYGVKDIIFKPFLKNELLDKVKNVLS